MVESPEKDPLDFEETVEENGIKIQLLYSDAYFDYIIKFPDLSLDNKKSWSNYFHVHDDPALAKDIFDHAAKLVRKGKSVEEVYNETGRFMIEFLRKKLPEDDPRRPDRDWEGKLIDIEEEAA